jgi:hypothetical protein
MNDVKQLSLALALCPLRESGDSAVLLSEPPLNLALKPKLALRRKESQRRLSQQTGSLLPCLPLQPRSGPTVSDQAAREEVAVPTLKTVLR